MNFFKKIVSKRKKKTVQLRHELTLNEKIQLYIAGTQGRAIPLREVDLRPEILIPCFNHAKYLANMLSVLRGVDVPITIIDDNSSEDDRLLIDELRGIFHFKLIRNEVNLRQGGALNKAIEDSANNLFIVANADDYLLPGWPDYVIGQFGSSEIRMMGGMHICFFNHFPRSERHLMDVVGSSGYRPQGTLRYYGPEDAKRFDHDNSIDMTMTGCAFLKSAWMYAGGFLALKDRVSIHDDRDFQMRVCASFQVGVSDDLSAFWRSDSSTGMGTK